MRFVFGNDAVDLLQAAAPNAKIIQVKSAAEAALAINGAEVFIGFCSPEVLSTVDTIRGY